MGLLDRIITTAATTVTRSVASAAGQAVGSAVTQVTNQAVKNKVTDMKLQAQAKVDAADRQRRINEKIDSLPETCPKCGAPTSYVLHCEYCGCKLIGDEDERASIGAPNESDYIQPDNGANQN